MLVFFIAILSPQFILHSSQPKESVFVNFNFISSSNEQAKELLLKLPKPILNESKTESLFQKINNHKLHIATVIILSSWTMTQLTLLFIEWKLKGKSCWSNKIELLAKNFLNKSKVNINTTEEIKQKLQTQEEVQKIFAQIEREEKMLNLHNKFTKKINWLWLNKFFWFEKEFTQERLLRLKMLKNLLSTNNNVVA